MGLAKLKYEHGGLHYSDLNPPLHSDKPSDSSSGSSRNRCGTPSSSPPLRAAAFSKNLPRSAHGKHAVTFNCRAIQPTLFASRKRRRSDSRAERSAKAPRFSGANWHQLLESSTHVNRPLTARQKHVSFRPEAPIAFPESHCPSDGEDYPDLPVHTFQNVSPMMGSSPPRTPPNHDCLPHQGWTFLHEDKAKLQGYLAESPTPARVATGSRHQALQPSSPSQYATIPPMTPNLGTQDHPFSFAEFLNVTPSPVLPARGGLTPGLYSASLKRINYPVAVYY